VNPLGPSKALARSKELLKLARIKEIKVEKILERLAELSSTKNQETPAKMGSARN
jgi:hypothetical protein